MTRVLAAEPPPEALRNGLFRPSGCKEGEEGVSAPGNGE